MSKQIPIYFDTVVVSSPIQEVSQGASNISRLKVRVFTKYANRNGSYITEEVANQLISSATSGNTPVVGFFDPETQSWASHTGPLLANAYGYVESFLGWEPFTDTDGETRDYAVFSVILFTDYFDEAQKIIGQNQSMELQINSISGDWAEINGQEYYVYTTARMLGFCIIGSHEPCFSVSAFFSKEDTVYKDQYEKFSSLLSNLKMEVEKINEKGGEQAMDDFNTNQPEELVVSPEVHAEESIETPVESAFSAEESETESAMEETVEAQPEVTDTSVEETPEEAQPDAAFEALQHSFDELVARYEELETKFNEAAAKVAEFENKQSEANSEIETLRDQNAAYAAKIENYETQIASLELMKKESLIEKYEKIMNDEDTMKSFKEQIDNFSYEELESKLAVCFAQKEMNKTESEKVVPLVEPQPSQFALFMEKYRRK